MGRRKVLVVEEVVVVVKLWHKQAAEEAMLRSLCRLELVEPILILGHFGSSLAIFGRVLVSAESLSRARGYILVFWTPSRSSTWAPTSLEVPGWEGSW